MLAIHLSRLPLRHRVVQFREHAPCLRQTRNPLKTSQIAFRTNLLTSIRSFSDQPSEKFSSRKTSPSKPSILSRILPSTFTDAQNASSLRKIVSLAKEERKPLLIGIGLLFVSSSVSMSIPFTVGKLIDFFSSTSPVRLSSFTCVVVTYTPHMFSKSLWACRYFKCLVFFCSCSQPELVRTQQGRCL